MRWLLLFFAVPVYAQMPMGGVTFAGTAPVPITLDATCDGQSGGSSVSSIACGSWSSTVTAGDLIVCAGNDQGASPTAVDDSVNGTYSPVQYNSGNYPPGGSIGFYAFSNSAGSAGLPTMHMLNSSTNVSIQCSAWKNAALAYFDPKINYWQINTSGAANPSTGLSQTPQNNGELLLAATMVNSTAPTAGSGFTLLNSPGACGSGNSCTYTQYEVQATAAATQCAFTATSQPFEASCIALMPTGASGGTAGNLSSIYTSFEAGTDGDQLSSTYLNTATTQYPTNSYEAPAWSGTASAQLTVENDCQHDLVTPVTVLGTTSTGTGTRGVQWNWASANNTNMQLNFPNTSFPNASIGFFFLTTVSPSDATNYYPHAGINDGGGDDFVSLQMHNGELYPETNANPNGNPDSCTGSGCDGNNKFEFADNTWYWITIQFQQTGSHHLAVYTYNGTSWVLAADMAKTSTATSNPFYVKIGTADYASNTGTSCVDNLVIDSLGGHFPVLP